MSQQPHLSLALARDPVPVEVHVRREAVVPRRRGAGWERPAVACGGAGAGVKAGPQRLSERRLRAAERARRHLDAAALGHRRGGGARLQGAAGGAGSGSCGRGVSTDTCR